jgi:carbamate kinase
LREKKVRLVVALGGNALLRRGEPAGLAAQRHNMAAAAAALAPLLAAHEAVITHGSGPQVGLLARQWTDQPVPLDLLDAQIEGMLGYLIEQELRNVLPGRDVVTVLSQVVVDERDPAFRRPEKPIGPVIPEAEARHRLTAGEVLGPDDGGFRRLVCSPAPRELVEAAAVLTLLRAGWLVISAGGGGIPVVRDAGGWRGVEAVVDKDATSALLAEGVDADFLMLLTDVPAVYRDWGTPLASPYGQVTPDELLGEEFAAGSMGPKVAAACGFVRRTRRPAGIGRLEEAAAIFAGRAGTQIVPQSSR